MAFLLCPETEHTGNEGGGEGRKTVLNQGPRTAKIVAAIKKNMNERKQSLRWGAEDSFKAEVIWGEREWGGGCEERKGD